MIYKLSKIMYIVFLFYIGWFLDVFFVMPKMSLFLGSGMIILLILSMMLSSKKTSLVIASPVYIWLIFVLYVLISGFFITKYTNHLINSIFTYVQTLALIIYIINISANEKDNKFFLKSYAVYSMTLMVTMLFWGHTGVDGRLRLSVSSNPNGDALVLLYGIFCILILFNSKKISRFIFLMGIAGLYIYTILLTGSRKAFLAAVLLIILWFVLVFRRYWTGYSSKNKILSIFILFVILTTLMIIFIPEFLESTTYMRLTGKGYSLFGNEARSGMYKEALNFFYNNPFFGIGFDHFRLLSSYGVYSHSTYAEIISTTGIIGALIYFSAYFLIVYNLIKIYIKKKGNNISIISLQYLVLMLVMLALGFGVIHFYRINDSIMFAFMISFYYTEKTNLLKSKKIRHNEFIPYRI
jgi:O-antigen ligase